MAFIIRLRTLPSQTATERGILSLRTTGFRPSPSKDTTWRGIEILRCKDTTIIPILQTFYRIFSTDCQITTKKRLQNSSPKYKDYDIKNKIQTILNQQPFRGGQLWQGRCHYFGTYIPANPEIKKIKKIKKFRREVTTQKLDKQRGATGV